MKITKKMREYFGERRTIFHASAPGRLDVMGGIADYSGSYVLQMPIAERTDVYVALRNDGVLRAYSTTAEDAELCADVTVDLGELNNKLSPDYAKVRKSLAGDEKTSWAAYVFGCAVALIQEKGTALKGADFWIDAKVPIGKGVSSSAALEVSTLSALCEALSVSMDGNELPVLAQKVENRIVGAPCGLMDQLATYFGRTRKLLPILCRPDRVESPIELADGINFVGVDSGERHAVSGSSYTDVRTAAFMGYTIVAEEFDVKKNRIAQAKKTGGRDGLPFNGYLTEISPSFYESKYEPLLPQSMSGGEFIKIFGTTIDPITTPDDATEYAVRDCSAHPIYENHRVKEFGLLLQFLNTPRLSKSVRESCYVQLGELMFQSHWSYSRCGLGCEATDSLVRRAYEAGPKSGVYGAKITGGGAGGTVCYLCVGAKGLQTVNEIASRHAEERQCELTVFNKSSEGARWTRIEKITL